VIAEWDSLLAPRMKSLDKVVHEEAILDVLCSDLEMSK